MNNELGKGMFGVCQNILRPTIFIWTQASQPPRVSGLPGEGLCSLVLSNPDGHLLHHSMELLHWMMYIDSGRMKF